MSQQDSEAQLIREATEGNMGAFSQLVRLHRARVVRTAYGVVGSFEEAEDVAQDVFVKVWNSLAEYRVRGAFASWLYRITVNTAIDALRKRRVESPLEDWQADSRAQPEDEVLSQASSERVKLAVSNLPPNARAALILREYEQLSYKEIAEALQIPIGTVMSRLNYARQLLKRELSGEM